MDEMQDFNSLERRLLDRAKLSGTPLNGSLELLPLCNMNCDMCFVRLSRSQMEAQGRMRTGQEWLTLGKEMADAGTLFLLLTGGEPLLHPDFKEIYLGLKKLGMIITINTNGTLIDKEWAAFFGENKPRRINITLYGADAATYGKLCHYPGGFDKVTNAVRLLRDQGVDVKLAGSMTPANVHQVDELLGVAQELEVPLHMDPYMMPGVREREMPFNMQSRLLPEDAAAGCMRYVRKYMGAEMFQQFREQALAVADREITSAQEPCPVSCMAGRCSFTVNWQGMMRPCVIMSQPEVPVFEIGFQESWKLIRESFGKVRFSPKCSNCRLRHLCRTCAAASMLETGDYLGTPEYLCRYAEQTECILRSWKEESTNG